MAPERAQAPAATAQAAAAPRPPLPEPGTEFGPPALARPEDIRSLRERVGAQFQEAGENAEPGTTGDRFGGDVYEDVAQLQGARGGATAGGAAAAPQQQFAVLPGYTNFAPVGGAREFLKTYADNPAREIEAAKIASNTEADGLLSLAQQKAAEAEHLQVMAENSRIREEERSRQMRAALEQYQAQADQLAQQKFDAGRFWKSPGNVFSALALALAPLGSTSLKDAMGMINARVEEDLNAQREDYQRASAGVASKLTTLGQLRSIFGDEQAAEDSYRASSMRFLAAKAEAAALRAKSDATRARGLEAAAAMKTQADRFATNAARSLYQPVTAAAVPVAVQTLRDQEKKFYDPTRPDTTEGDVMPSEDFFSESAPKTAADMKAEDLAARKAKSDSLQVSSLAQAALEKAKGTVSPFRNWLFGDKSPPPPSPAEQRRELVQKALQRTGVAKPVAEKAKGDGVDPAVTDPQARAILAIAQKENGGKPFAREEAQDIIDKAMAASPNNRLKVAAETGAFYNARNNSAYGQNLGRYENDKRRDFTDSRNLNLASNTGLGVMASRDTDVKLRVRGKRTLSDGSVVDTYELDGNGVPIPDTQNPAARKRYYDHVAALRERAEKRVDEFRKVFEENLKNSDTSISVAEKARSIRTIQERLLKRYAGNMGALERAFTYASTTRGPLDKLASLGVTDGKDQADFRDLQDQVTSLLALQRNKVTGQNFSKEENADLKRAIVDPNGSFQDLYRQVGTISSAYNKALADALALYDPPTQALIRARMSASRNRPGATAAPYTTPGR